MSQEGKLPSPSKMELLELDIDTRLTDLWREVSATETWDLERVAGFMRAAYGRGYLDAVTETPEDRGRLTRDHGYGIPPPRPLPTDPEL